MEKTENPQNGQAHFRDEITVARERCEVGGSRTIGRIGRCQPVKNKDRGVSSRTDPAAFAWMKTRLGYQAAGAGVRRRDIRRVHPRSTASLPVDLRNNGNAAKNIKPTKRQNAFTVAKLKAAAGVRVTLRCRE